MRFILEIVFPFTVNIILVGPTFYPETTLAFASSDTTGVAKGKALANVNCCINSLLLLGTISLFYGF